MTPPSAQDERKVRGLFIAFGAALVLALAIACGVAGPVAEGEIAIGLIGLLILAALVLFYTEVARLIASRNAALLNLAREKEAVKRSEEERKSILRNATEGFVLLDAHGRLLEANEAYCRTSGYSEQELLSMWIGDLEVNESPEEITAHINKVITEGEDRFESRHRRKDGTPFDIEIGVKYRPVNGGQFAVITRDITERKRAEEALKQADHRKDEFLATLAHELRNPMSAISAAATLICRPGIAPEKVRFASEALKQRVTQLGRLIDDLLDVSRIIRGKIELRKEDLDLEFVITRAVDSSRICFDERKQRLSVRINDSLPVYGDPVRLEQIISNLLTNASRYSQEGQEASLTAFRDGNEAVVLVKDSGIGIPPAMLSKIFDAFTQVEKPLDRKNGGLGLGLTIVKNLCELHGGTVAVTSVEGQGSEFEVRLPLGRPHARPRIQKEETRLPRALNILVAEDHQDTAMMSVAILESQGHAVEIAPDGPSAVEKALRSRPDMILLDIGLPGFSGYEVARRIRQGGLKDTIIVAVTGYGQEQDVAHAREAGINEHLLKPVDYEKLIPLVARYEERRTPQAAFDA